MFSTTLDRWLRVDERLQFDNRVLSNILRLWESRLEGRRMPARADFLPHILSDHLGWIALLDVERSPLRFRYRLVGTGITQAVGRDSTGRYLDELYEPDIYEIAASGFRRVVETQRPVRVQGKLEQVDKGFMRYEALELPLSDDGVEVNMVMTRCHFD